MALPRGASGTVHLPSRAGDGEGGHFPGCRAPLASSLKVNLRHRGDPGVRRGHEPGASQGFPGVGSGHACAEESDPADGRREDGPLGDDHGRGACWETAPGSEGDCGVASPKGNAREQMQGLFRSCGHPTMHVN